ncbi:hypothetical protein EC957_000395 [Mortierella hygrophila]|uniref:EF-hand domain-containing protein n=1 Tax=Mortierella hygrophila TaxID=979708 RepID=A0A9P6F7Q7_9FUNG|nr:hypothetical protein EC957_000395 [Mortierella hygrophila]
MASDKEHNSTGAAINDDQVKEFKEAFNLFDRKGSGNIAASSLGNLLRSIGQNPTQSEIQELVAQADPSSTGVVSFDSFTKVAMRADGFKPAGTTDQLIEGFKVFDTQDNGTIPATELRHVLTTMGEVLTAEEIEELMAGALVDKDGLVNYEVFVRDLLA